MGNSGDGREGAAFSASVSCLSKNAWEGGERGKEERTEGEGGEGRKYN